MKMNILAAAMLILFAFDANAREIHRNTETYSVGAATVKWSAIFVQKSPLTYSFVYEWEFWANGIRYRGNRREIDLGHPAVSRNPFVEELFIDPSNASTGVRLFVDFDYSGVQRSACSPGGHAVGLIAKHYFRSVVGNVVIAPSEAMRLHYEIDLDKKHTSASGDGCAQLREVYQ
jgi:hypothetical protein